MKLRSLLWIPRLIIVAIGVMLRFRGMAEQVSLAREQIVPASQATIQVTVRGEGETVVLVPTLGRGVEDFDNLSARLVQAGYRTVLPQPRGIGRSAGPLQGLTLHDLGADIAAVITAVGGAPVTIIGHAFGSRIARVVASDHPALVRQVILLSAGGMTSMPPDLLEASRHVFDTTLPRNERLAAIRRIYFASGNDPAVWEHGWHPAVVPDQLAANSATPVRDWWAGGSVPMLVLQGAEDAAAPPENATMLANEFGKRVTVVTIPGAGHAMLPEQPERIASAILNYLRASAGQ